MDNDKIIEWGFDLTEFQSVKQFENLLKIHRLKSGYKRVVGPDYTTFTWSNTNLKLITGNNPITGENMTPQYRKPEKRYAGYIGIVGKKKYVLALANDIKQTAQYIKGESPFRRDYI